MIIVQTQTRVSVQGVTLSLMNREYLK